jgi:hypothetical protein
VVEEYRNPAIAQLAERETVDGLTTDISRSLVRIRVGGSFWFVVSVDGWMLLRVLCVSSSHTIDYTRIHNRIHPDTRYKKK